MEWFFFVGWVAGSFVAGWLAKDMQMVRRVRKVRLEVDGWPHDEATDLRAIGAYHAIIRILDGKQDAEA